MPDVIERYITQPAIATMKRQAWKVWALSSIVVFLWVFMIVFAPLAKASGIVAISDPLYRFFSYICHQISPRAFHVEGEQFAVCSRCFGVYFGLFAGFLIYPLWRRIDEIE